MCDNLVKTVDKIDPKAMDRIREVASEIGPVPPIMLYAINDLPNSGEILNHLSNDPDRMEELYAMTPVKMAIELKTISDELKPKPAKLVETKRSRVPPPITPINANGRGASSGFDPSNTKISDKDWIKQREADVARKRQNGRSGLM